MTETPTDYRAVVSELLALWDEQIEKSTVTLRLDLAYWATPILVRGLTAHAVDAARAVLTLYRAKQTIAAVPLVRAVMEDALTAVWLLADADAARSFRSDAAMQRARTLREILSRVDDPADVEAKLRESRSIIEELGTPSRHLIEQRFRALDGGDGGLYLQYRIMSSLTHAGAGVIDLYSAPDDRAPTRAVFRAYGAHPTAAAWMSSTATYLLHALGAWDACQLDHPQAARLRALADRMGLRSEYAVATTE